MGNFFEVTGSGGSEGKVDFKLKGTANLVLENSNTLPGSGVEGQIYWKSDTNELYIYNGSAWQLTSGASFPLLAPNGTLSAPSYSWALETNSGWYRAGAGDLILAVTGSKGLELTGSNFSIWPETTTFAPGAGAFLDTVTLQMISASFGKILYIPSVSPHAWSFRNSSNVSAMYIMENGQVGINTPSIPTSTLDVYGNALIRNNGSLTINTHTNQLIFGDAAQTTINVAIPGSSVTITVPDPGATASFVLTQGSQTIAGLKQFSNNVGIGGAAITNGLLTLTSTTAAFVPPRMTQTQRDAITSPTAGMLVYNNTSGALSVYTGSWQDVSAGGGVTYPLLATAGSVGAPSYSWSGDATTGWYHLGSGDVALSISGTKVEEITASTITMAIPLRLPDTAVGSIPQLQIGAANTGLFTGIAGRIGIMCNGTTISQLTSTAFQLTGSTQLIIDAPSNQMLFDHGGSGQTTLHITNPSTSRLYTVPDTGTSTANFMLTEGSQTINGLNTFSNDLTVGTRVVLTGNDGSGQAISCNQAYAGSLTWLLQNTDATGEARLLITNTSGSGGDSYTSYDVGVNAWATGADNSDSDKYKISYGAGVNPHLGTNDVLVCTMSNQILPGADNTIDLGISGTRFANIWGVTIHSGDIALENGWRITEGDKVGYPDEGVMFLSPTGKKFKIAMTEVE